MGFAINWQQQSNTWINLAYTPFTCLTVIPLTMPLLLLLWNEIWVEIYMKKAVINKRPIASYIYMHADVTLEHLLWTMHNGSFKSHVLLYTDSKSKHPMKTKQKESSGLMFTFGKYSPQVYSKLHSRH